MIPSDKVSFVDSNLEEEYNNLPENDPIKKGIKKAIEKIKEDCQAGESVKKDSSILYFYKKKFGVNNIRIYDLPLFYRLVYSLSSNEIEIISVILDWKDHKEYNKLNK